MDRFKWTTLTKLSLAGAVKAVRGGGSQALLPGGGVPHKRQSSPDSRPGKHLKIFRLEISKSFKNLKFFKRCALVSRQRCSAVTNLLWAGAVKAVRGGGGEALLPRSGVCSRAAAALQVPKDHSFEAVAKS